MNYFLFFAIGQGLLLAALCFSLKERNKIGFMSLAIMMVSFCLILLEQWVFSTPITDSWLIHFKRSTTWLPFIIGPCFYLAANSLVEQRGEFQIKHALHLVPAIAHLLYLLPFYLQDAQDKLSTVNQTPTDTILFATAKAILLTIYLLKAQQRLRTHQHNDTSGLTRKLLVTINIFLVSVLIMAMFFYFEAFSQNNKINADMLSAGLLATFLSVTSVLYLVNWKQFVLKQLPNTNNQSTNATSKQQEQQQWQHLFEQIDNHVVKHQLFTNAELKIDTLASELDLPTHSVSYVINLCSESNFNAYINQHRVNLVKQLLISSDNKPHLLSIAHQAGFNSKASFNRAFKDNTKLTPGQFWEQNHQS